jgi:hypothetical protein
MNCYVSISSTPEEKRDKYALCFEEEHYQALVLAFKLAISSNRSDLPISYNTYCSLFLTLNKLT